VTNEIADDLARACAPRFLRLAGKFNVRGGIYTTVVVERRQERLASPAGGQIALIWRRKSTGMSGFSGGCTGKNSPV